MVRDFIYSSSEATKTTTRKKIILSHLMFVPSVAIHQQDYSTFPLLMSIWSIIQTTLTFGQGTILVMWELIRKFWNRESLPENSEIRGGSKGGRTAEESTDDSYFQHSIIHPCYQLYSAMIYGVKNKICLSAEMEKFTHSRPVQLSALG